MTRGRRGFGLAELLVAMVITGIIGVALTRLVISQARFVGMQDAMLRARGGARASLNLLSDELKMVPFQGVRQAHAESVEVRIPYAFGVACFPWSGYMIVTLLPADSATYAGATPSGYAWRNNATGAWTIRDGGTILTGTNNNVCSSVAMTEQANSNWPERWAAISPWASGIDTTSAIMLYQRIRYAFAPSVQLPGRVALWRTVMSTGLREELVAPFDTASHFEFLTGSRYAAQTAVPALDSIRGLRVRLKAASETTPQGRTAPTTFDVSVDVYFRNYEP